MLKRIERGRNECYRGGRWPVLLGASARRTKKTWFARKGFPAGRYAPRPIRRGGVYGGNGNPPLSNLRKQENAAAKDVVTIVAAGAQKIKKNKWLTEGRRAPGVTEEKG